MQANKMIYLLLIVLCIFLMSGCSDDDPVSSNEQVPEELVETWYAQSVTLNGVAQNRADWFEWDTATVSARTTMDTDFTYLYEERDDSSNTLYYESGLFAINGTNMTLTVNNENGQSVAPETLFNGTWVVTGTELILTMIDNADTVIMIWNNNI